MPRPKSFDVDDVLDRAIDVFWLHGLAATSVGDLVNHLGINRGSLYATFNSKEELYQRALDRYHHESMEWIREQLSPDGRTLRQRLTELFHASASSDDHRGCFMMNTAVERNSVDDGFRDVTTDAIEEMAAVLTEAFEAAAAEGGVGNELVSDHTAATAATVVITAIQGLRTMATMTEPTRRPAAAPTIDLVLGGLFGPASG